MTSRAVHASGGLRQLASCGGGRGYLLTKLLVRWLIKKKIPEKNDGAKSPERRWNYLQYPGGILPTKHAHKSTHKWRASNLLGALRCCQRNVHTPPGTWRTRCTQYQRRFYQRPWRQIRGRHCPAPSGGISALQRFEPSSFGVISVPLTGSKFCPWFMRDLGDIQPAVESWERFSGHMIELCELSLRASRFDSLVQG